MSRLGGWEFAYQVKEAVQLLEKVVQIREQSLPENYPSRLASQHVLATILWELGWHIEALQIMGHVVEINKRLLNRDHPDRMASEEWLKIFEDEGFKHG